MAAESTRTVVVALVANALIAASKFGAAAVTGSSAMISEGIHSVVDTANQGILLYGTHRGERPADEKHPFGYSHEVYFWALVVAIVIFGIGGGMSILEGVSRLRTPHELGDPFWNYVVLGIAIVLEGISFAVALRGMSVDAAGRNLWRQIREGKDPVAITVFLEDSAALTGLAVALAATLAANYFHNPAFDAWGSIAIGLVLASVAFILVYESRGLLVGESALPEVVAGVRAVAAAEPAVVRINRALTLQLGPQNVILALDVTFRGDLRSADVAEVSSRLQNAIRSRYPDIHEIFIEAQQAEAPVQAPPA
jgi:cation diffusion facilitator family transporter